MQAIIDFFKHFWETIVKFFSENGQTMLVNTILALIVLIVGHYLIKLILFILRKSFKISKKQVDRSARSFLISFVAIVLRFLLAIGVLTILQVKLDGIISILSAGVLAIGLSLQDSIGNFAAGVMLISTKPFKTDDFIEIKDNISGTVVDVRMMTTVLNTPDNQKVIIPNSEVMKSTIINFSAQPTRRIDLTFDIDYGTDLEKAKKVALNVLKNDSRILSTPVPITMIKGTAASSIILGVRGYSNTEDYWDAVWSINEKIILAFREEGIVIPFNKLDVNLVKSSKDN